MIDETRLTMIQRIMRSRGWTLIVPIIASHLVIVILGFSNRLVYSVPSPYELLTHIVDSGMWTLLHGLGAFFLTLSIRLHRFIIPALSASSGMLAAYGLLALVWGISTTEPVSLLGPCMALIAGFAAHLLAVAFAGGTLRHPYGNS